MDGRYTKLLTLIDKQIFMIEKYWYQFEEWSIVTDGYVWSVVKVVRIYSIINYLTSDMQHDTLLIW